MSGGTHSVLPSSKSIVLLESFHVESIFKTCRISELTPVTSWSITFAGIFIFSLWGESAERSELDSLVQDDVGY